VTLQRLAHRLIAGAWPLIQPKSSPHARATGSDLLMIPFAFRVFRVFRGSSIFTSSFQKQPHALGALFELLSESDATIQHLPETL
jgi:hypothetical protein